MVRQYRPTPEESEKLAQLRDIALVHRALEDVADLAKVLRNELVVQLYDPKRFAGGAIADAAFTNRYDPRYIVSEWHKGQDEAWLDRIGDPGKLISRVDSYVGSLRRALKRSETIARRTEEKRTG